MLKVHRPRVYRSVQGCCICRAKSSSSRFTDSARYEQYFKACFHILEPRHSSEICNACVLLTKRFQKLPPESTKDWRHVVDVREANSSKTAAKGAFNSESKSKKSTKFSKHRYRSRYLTSSDRESSPTLPLGSSASPVPPFLSPEPTSTDSPSGGIISSKDLAAERQLLRTGRDGEDSSTAPEMSDIDTEGLSEGGEGDTPSLSSFIDRAVWRRERVCCGLLFRGPFGAVIIDQRFWRPCHQRHNRKSNLGGGDSSSPSNFLSEENKNIQVETMSEILTPENSAPSSENLSPTFTQSY